MSLRDVPKRDKPDVFDDGESGPLGGISAVVQGFLPVVPELKGDPEVVVAQQADDILQLVL